MKNILVIGSTGQIGSELTLELRKHYGENVVAGYIPGAEPKGALAETGPAAIADITNGQQIADTVAKYRVDTVYNLAALLSAVAESKHRLAWHIGIDGLMNVLEVARERGCAVFTPSSIGAFGDGAPKDMTPQDTICRPHTMYGVTKVTGELLSDYYYTRFGVDTRGVRFPGLISYVTPPGGGTTDYAVDIFYAADGLTLLSDGQRVFPADYLPPGDEAHWPMTDLKLTDTLKEGATTTVCAVWPDTGQDTLTLDHQGNMNDTDYAFRLTNIPTTDS